MVEQRIWTLRNYRSWIKGAPYIRKVQVRFLPSARIARLRAYVSEVSNAGRASNVINYVEVSAYTVRLALPLRHVSLGYRACGKCRCQREVIRAHGRVYSVPKAFLVSLHGGIGRRAGFRFLSYMGTGSIPVGGTQALPIDTGLVDTQ